LRAGAQSGQEEVGWQERLRTFFDDRRPSNRWHFVTNGKPSGSAYFVGYDSLTKEQIGYLGTRGFQDIQPSLQTAFPFSGTGEAIRDRLHSPNYYYPSYGSVPALMAPTPMRDSGSGDILACCVCVQADDGRIYMADLSARTVRSMLENPTIRSTALLSQWIQFPEKSSRSLAVRTDSEILVLKSSGDIVNRFVIPEHLREQDFEWAPANTTQAIYYTRATPDEFSPEAAYRIYWCDASGDCSRSENLVLRDHSPHSDLRIGLAGLFPGPALSCGYVGFYWPQHMLANPTIATYGNALSRSAGQFRWAIVLAIVIGVACAASSYRRQRRYASSTLQCAIWTSFVFLLGLPGWIGYRFGRSWPALEPCQGCGALSPRDRGDCAACHAEFPTPTLKGTEILAA
jgi:hypothetical protein